MPCLRLPRRLLPARRALKGLSTAVRAGLYKLLRGKPARGATSTLRSVDGYGRSLLGSRSRVEENGSWTRRVVARRCSYEPPRSTKRFEPVYVDELVGGGNGCGPCSGPADGGSGPAPSKAGRREGLNQARLKGPVMAFEVDERAEEFIERFREEMRLQREQSIEEFKEMLARGAT